MRYYRIILKGSALHASGLTYYFLLFNHFAGAYFTTILRIMAHVAENANNDNLSTMNNAITMQPPTNPASTALHLLSPLLDHSLTSPK